MKNYRKNKGITLIALVITIILLLILAGITITSLTGSGLFEKAKESKEKSEKAQIKEEIEIAIMDIQIEEISKGNEITLEILEKELPNKLKDIVAKLENEEITGEYKNYIYTIDNNFNVKIEAEATGIKPDINADVLTEENVLEGSLVQIQVTARITEGSVNIVVPDNMTLLNKKIDTDLEKIYVYTVSKNGDYKIIAQGNSGRKTTTTVKVNKILERPVISITDITMASMKVNINNSGIEGVSYTYYLDGVEIENAKNISETNYIINDLSSYTEYRIKVGMTYNGTEIFSEELVEKTQALSLSSAIDFWPLKENFNNQIETSTSGNMTLLGTGETSFEDGLELTGETYIQTANNYVFPEDFTMMIQVKGLDLARRDIQSVILGQGNLSNWSDRTGHSADFLGIHWYKYYPYTIASVGTNRSIY